MSLRNGISIRRAVGAVRRDAGQARSHARFNVHTGGIILLVSPVWGLLRSCLGSFATFAATNDGQPSEEIVSEMVTKRRTVARPRDRRNCPTLPRVTRECGPVRDSACTSHNSAQDLNGVA